MGDIKQGLIFGSIIVMLNLIIFIAHNTVYLSEYPLYVTGLMMIGLYVIGVTVFTGMYSLGSYLLKD